MKAKHAIARIKGLAVWQKIFCALLALTLVSLMIPSGLRASAESLNGEAQNDGIEATAGEVNSILDLWPKVGTTIDFNAVSYNSADTAGYFTQQTIDLDIPTLVSIIKNKLMMVRGDILEILFKFLDSSNVPQNEDQLAQTILDIDTAIDYFGDEGAFEKGDKESRFLAFAQLLLTEIKEVPVQDNAQIDLTKALWTPDITDGERTQSGPFKYINHIVPTDDINWVGAQSIANDGSIFMLYVTLGEGSLVDAIAGTTVHLTRIIPIMPALELPFMAADNGLLGAGANDSQDNAATENARFLNWEISNDGGKSFIPLSWSHRYHDGPIPVYSDSSYIFKGNFYDLEGWTKVNIDFGVETRDSDLIDDLYEAGWYTTGIGGYGTVWSKLYPSWMSKGYVYNSILGMLWNFAETDNAYAYKDRNLALLYNRDLFGTFPGPHWVEVSDDDWFGTLESGECTMTFSWYPVSPLGHVNNPTIKSIKGDIDFEEGIDIDIYDINFSVSNADVMFYNEWGFPLFNYRDANYISDPSWLPEWLDPEVLRVDLIYCYFNLLDGWQYCFDQEISYAVVTAHGYNSTRDYFDMGDSGTVYIPMRVDAEQLKEKQTDFLFTYYLDFNVEALMTASFAPGYPADVDNFEVTYYEDGQPLFDPLVLDNFWALQFFTMPLSAGGTLQVDGNGDLVSTFDAYFDYWRPWAADPMNAFSDPSQFDPTPGVTHNFQCRIHVNTVPGKIVHGWNYDFVFHIGLGDVLPLTNFVLDEHQISPIVVDSAVVDATGGEGHASFHIDYYVDSFDYFKPTFSFDFPSGFGDVYAGTEYSVQADGTLLAYHYDPGIFHNHSEAGVITAVGQPGYQVTSWTINGVNYPVGVAAENVATASVDTPTTIVANYNGAVPQPVDPDNPGGGGTAQTSDFAGLAFAILAMIALAGAGILAGRKLYIK